MQLKRVFFVLFLGFQLVLFSQNAMYKPQFKKIKKQIKKKKSKFYYPNLVKKYSRGLPMSLAEKQYFYYGYAFLKSYTPYQLYKYNQKINGIIMSKDYSQNNLQKLLNYINLELAIHPFDIRLLKIKKFVYKRLHDLQNLKIVQQQIEVIKDAILNSGNGLTAPTAYVVVFENNQYDVLEFLGLKKKEKKYLNKNTEVIEVNENSKKIKKIYFNVGLLTGRLNTKKK